MLNISRLLFHSVDIFSRSSRLGVTIKKVFLGLRTKKVLKLVLLK